MVIFIMFSQIDCNLRGSVQRSLSNNVLFTKTYNASSPASISICVSSQGLENFYNIWGCLTIFVVKVRPALGGKKAVRSPQSSVWEKNNLTRWQDDKMTWWQDVLMTRWPDDKMTRWQDDKMTRWQEDKMTRGQDDKLENKCCIWYPWTLCFSKL